METFLAMLLALTPLAVPQDSAPNIRNKENKCKCPPVSGKLIYLLSSALILQSQCFFHTLSDLTRSQESY